MTSDASLSAREAFCSPSAAITWEKNDRLEIESAFYESHWNNNSHDHERASRKGPKMIIHLCPCFSCRLCLSSHCALKLNWEADVLAEMEEQWIENISYILRKDTKPYFCHTFIRHDTVQGPSLSLSLSYLKLSSSWKHELRRTSMIFCVHFFVFHRLLNIPAKTKDRETEINREMNNGINSVEMRNKGGDTISRDISKESSWEWLNRTFIKTRSFCWEGTLIKMYKKWAQI